MGGVEEAVVVERVFGEKLQLDVFEGSGGDVVEVGHEHDNVGVQREDDFVVHCGDVVVVAVGGCSGSSAVVVVQ